MLWREEINLLWREAHDLLKKCLLHVRSQLHNQYIDLKYQPEGGKSGAITDLKVLKNLNMDKLLVEGAEAGFRGPSSAQG